MKRVFFKVDQSSSTAEPGVKILLRTVPADSNTIALISNSLFHIHTLFMNELPCLRHAHHQVWVGEKRKRRVESSPGE